ncbi:MAG: L,D-transpeptidase [Bacteroidales bacterium]|nr:L,D-transpeptidase [Bacteroidales bacterium]
MEKGIYSDGRLFVISRKILAGVLGFAAFVSLVIFLNYIIPAMQELTVHDGNRIINSDEIKESADYNKQISQLKRDIQYLSSRYNGLATSQSYLVINTTDNLFHLYRNKKLIREGHCSSGSYKMLKTEEGRSWIFKTPKGKFRVLGKMTNPAWRRPDWAFVEEGLPIPPQDHPSRYEYGVLGEYAMALGDGYLIHGTLYKRFLGMPVTHGCVRLNDEDLEAIFHALTIGSIVYIF